MSTALPMLKLSNVSRSFGAFKAVCDVSEEFAPGEIITIIGPNGAGKSTLLNMICGTLPVSSGTITYGHRRLSGLSGDRIARLGIARKFQVPSVFGSLTVLENLMVSAVSRDSDLIERTIDLVDLYGDRHVRAADLPHGKKQWLEIGMALSMQPKVLLLDEPTAGLSVEETRATARFLKDLEGKVTVIVIEHDMAFVRDLAARTIVLHHGRVIASGNYTDIEDNELVRDVYLGRR